MRVTAGNKRGSAGWRIVAAVLAIGMLAIPAVAASTVRDDLDAARDELDSILDRLGKQTTLDRSATSELKRDLKALARDLDGLSDRMGNNSAGGGIGGGGVKPSHPGGDWTLYQQAESDIWPSWAQFSKWDQARKFKAETDDEEGTLHFTVDNKDYTAEWTIRQAYSGNPRVTVDPMATGDVYVTLRDDRGTREFLLKNGGIGPLYTRRGTSGPVKTAEPPRPGSGTMAWVQPYNDLVKAGQLSRSPGMDWFVDQVQRGQYANNALETLGKFLRNELPEQVQGEIATLKYTQLFQTKRIAVPDPRNSVSTFVYAMDKAYGLHQQGTDFSIELK